MATTTLKVKDLKDEKQWIFLPDPTWAKVLEVVGKWVKKGLSEDKGNPPERPNKDFFNKAFLRSLRGMSPIEVDRLMDEILAGISYLKTNTDYTGRFDYKQRATDLRTLTLMEREVLHHVNSNTEVQYPSFKDLLAAYPAFTEQRLLDIAGMDTAYIKQNINKTAVLGTLPSAMLASINEILQPKMRNCVNTRETGSRCVQMLVFRLTLSSSMPSCSVLT